MTPRTRGRVFGGAVVIVATALLIAWLLGADQSGNSTLAPRPMASERVAMASESGTTAPSEPAAHTAHTAHAASGIDTTATWPMSLRDSEPDGAVTLDVNGRVRPSIELRRLFDYFLTALGERDVAAIRTLLLDHVRSLHGDAVAAEVAVLFDRYVDYQQALAAMSAPPHESLRTRLDRVHELRRRLLDSAMAEAFFGDEERYTAYTLDRRDVLADATLGERERQQRLDELDAQLSPAQRAGMHETNVAVLVDEQNRQFDALRLDPAQRQAERETLFGAEAAQRLAQADAEQVAWDARVASYVQARDAIRADTRRDATAREHAIAQLRAHSFDAAEQRRILSLEAIRRL